MVVCQQGEACLHTGCKYGHSSVVQYLVTTHTNLDLQDMVSCPSHNRANWWIKLFEKRVASLHVITFSNADAKNGQETM